MERRDFLNLLGAGVVAAATSLLAAHTGIVRMRVPYGTIYGLPGTGNLMALTVDDGNSSAVVREYVAFAQQTGMRGAPYFRPPYGKHDARVDQLAAGIGYSTPVLWYRALSDSGEITPEQLVSFADQWILPEHIVTRKIQPATLDDL